LPKLPDIEDVLLQCHYILCLLGFNTRQIGGGFYASWGKQPFSAIASLLTV
jgi:hypothetical protein